MSLSASELVKVIEQLAESSGKSLPNIEPDTPLFSSGLLDSLAAVQLMLYLEKNYQVRLSEAISGVIDLDTIAKIQNLVDSTPKT